MKINLSKTEEDYLKAIYRLTISVEIDEVGINSIAEELRLKPATVNGMIKRLKSKDLINYERYGKVSLTKETKKLAVLLIRKHRLWETFLSEKLNFSWSEVHEVAEQLEHIKSPKLIAELDKFLGYPNFDPHGEFIPDKHGKIPKDISNQSLDEIEINKSCTVVSVSDDSADFLKYLEDIGIKLNTKIMVIEKRTFDDSLLIEFNKVKETISKEAAKRILVR